MRAPKQLLVPAALAAALVALSVPGAEAGAPQQHASDPQTSILVFSRTTGFRHMSITKGVETVRELGDANGFAVEWTEDPTAFNPANLERFDAVLFLSTTGTILDAAQKAAFEQYIRGGGGYAGVHSASDTEHEWPFYGELVGAYFRSHPLQQVAMVDTEDSAHPTTSHLPARFAVFDEFYSFDHNPRPDVHVLLSIDETTYLPDPNTSNLPGGGTPVSGRMGDHPMAWCHDNVGGRSFYTALGHEAHLYDEPWYRQHLLAGIQLAAGAIEGTCTAPPDEDVTVRIAQDRVVFGRDRRGKVAIACPAREASSPCSGRLALRARVRGGLAAPMVLARAKFRIAAGKTDRVGLRISPGARRLVREEATTRADLVAKVRDDAGNRARVRARADLRAR